MKTFVLTTILLSSISIFAQNTSTYDAGVANHYFDFSLKLVKETAGYTPPVAARAFGYMGLTLYESVVEGMPAYSSTVGHMYEFNAITSPDPGTEYHWPTVANNALSTIIDTLFRTATAVNKDSLATIKEYYNNLFQSQVSTQVFEDSKTFGEAIGTDVLNYSKEDGGHNAFAQNFPADYVPPVGEEMWIPFGMQSALQPYWGSLRPFIEEDTIETISPNPPAFSTVPGSEFYEYAYDVYETSLTLTPEETNIALYWADGGGTITPPGHSISILNNILIEEQSNLETAALSYAKLGIAVSDAFLACWKTKYIYNLCRPVSYIRSYIDSTWLPLMVTPPFPEYPSGHSSQSGAMAEVMTSLFGSTYSFTDSTHGASFGGPRSFSSFDEAAAEAAISRLYGGIHYEFGNEAGLTLGQLVGENVNALFAELNVATEHPDQPLASLSIYPNPAVDYVTIIAAADVAGTSFQLFDLYGKPVYSGSITGEQTTFPVKDLVGGIYLLQAGDGASHTYKVIKN